MGASRRQLLAALVGVAAVGAVGCLSRPFRLREFRGTLRCQPDLIGLPEDPPPLASLATPTGTHSLAVPRDTHDRKLLRELADMNGKEVMVRGRWGVRWTKRREYWVIRVHDLRLAAPSATTAPAGGPG